jgi:creatinine amidohydrolase
MYSWQDYWSRMSQEGVCGDATAATQAYGEILFETTVTRFVELVREFRSIPLRPRRDHHE